MTDEDKEILAMAAGCFVDRYVKMCDMGDCTVMEVLAKASAAFVTVAGMMLGLDVVNGVNLYELKEHGLCVSTMMGRTAAENAKLCQEGLLLFRRRQKEMKGEVEKIMAELWEEK